MSNSLDLREKRAKAWEAAKAFLDSKRGTDGKVSAEDAAVYDKMEADIVSLGKEIERIERQSAIDMELAKPTSNPILNQPHVPAPCAANGSSVTLAGLASNEYTNAFWTALREKNQAIIHQPSVQNALSVGVDTEGGYTVPDEFERRLIEGLEEENIFRRLATVIRTSSGERKIPVVASKGEASWVDEAQLIPESDVEFAQVSIGAYKIATMLRVSEELLQDSVFNLEAYIAKEFARRIGEKEEEAFFGGNGNGKPTGILCNTGGAPVGVTTAAAGTITIDEILDLMYSLKAPYRKRASFIMNDATVGAVRKLKDNNGQYLWQPSVNAATPDTLIARPLYTSVFMPPVKGGEKTVAFGDFSYYWVADRQGRTFRRLNELYAATGQVGFIGTQRVDGKLILPESIKLLKQKAGA
jgi:HK97 family phage major capsid protein